MKNTQRHAIILALMAGTITLIFVMLGLVDFNEETAPPAEEQQPQLNPVDTQETRDKLDGQYQMTIWEATWGANCNAYVARMERDYAHLSREEMNRRQIYIPARVRENNVLADVSEECNGFSWCEIKANEGTFGQPPVGICGKKLKVVYRCYSYDRRREAEVSDGETMMLDCRGI